MSIKSKLDCLEKQMGVVSLTAEERRELVADLDRKLGELAELIRGKPGRLEEMGREAAAKPDPRRRWLRQAVVEDLGRRLLA